MSAQVPQPATKVRKKTAGMWEAHLAVFKRNSNCLHIDPVYIHRGTTASVPGRYRQFRQFESWREEMWTQPHGFEHYVAGAIVPACAVTHGS